jgi:hypothetical protein
MNQRDVISNDLAPTFNSSHWKEKHPTVFKIAKFGTSTNGP